MAISDLPDMVSIEVAMQLTFINTLLLTFMSVNKWSMSTYKYFWLDLQVLVYITHITHIFTMYCL